MNTRERLEYLRGELRAERITYGELAELQGLAEHIEPGDVELLEAAGAPESTQRVRVTTNCTADLREHWLGDAPAHLAGGGLHEWCEEALRCGNLGFDSEEASGEHDREIEDIEVLPEPVDTAPEGDPQKRTWLVTGAYARWCSDHEAQVYETSVEATSAEEAEAAAQRECAESNGYHDDEMPEEPMLVDVFARPKAPEWDDDLAAEVKRALEGDSNDAEHDALVSVAAHFGIDYAPIDYLAGDA